MKLREFHLDNVGLQDFSQKAPAAIWTRILIIAVFLEENVVTAKKKKKKKRRMFGFVLLSSYFGNERCFILVTCFETLLGGETEQETGCVNQTKAIALE